MKLNELFLDETIPEELSPTLALEYYIKHLAGCQQWKNTRTKEVEHYGFPSEVVDSKGRVLAKSAWTEPWKLATFKISHEVVLENYLIVHEGKITTNPL